MVFGEDGQLVADGLYKEEAKMKSMNRLAPWLNRVVLVAASILFAAIAIRYIANPIQASIATGVTMSSGLATTTTRIGFGAFPLGFALFGIGCLLSGRLIAGISLVATVDATVILVRLFSLVADGPVAGSTRLFLPEVILLLLSISSLLLASARNSEAANPHRAQSPAK